MAKCEDCGKNMNDLTHDVDCLKHQLSSERTAREKAEASLASATRRVEELSEEVRCCRLAMGPASAEIISRLEAAEGAYKQALAANDALIAERGKYEAKVKELEAELKAERELNGTEGFAGSSTGNT